MAKKAKLSPNKAAYRKEVARIKRFITNAKKKGYIFEDDLIPEEPKRVTKKALERIRAIKPKTLYAKSYYVDAETGEAIPGAERRAEEQKQQRIRQRERRKLRAAQKRANQAEGASADSGITYGNPENAPYWADVVIANFRAAINGHYINNSTGQIDRNDLKSDLEQMLDAAIEAEGRDAVAQKIKDNAEELSTLIDTALLASDQQSVSYSLVKFGRILKGSPLSLSESIALTELAEAYEDWEDIA